MLKKNIKIINKLGLHARASGKFTQTAARFGCDVWVTHQKRRVNGKSIMGLMMLAASCGSEILLETDGSDEKRAMRALTDLINNRFDEEE